AEHLPLLARAGVRHLQGLVGCHDSLVAAGLPPEALKAILAAPPPPGAVSTLALVAAGRGQAGGGAGFPGRRGRGGSQPEEGYRRASGRHAGQDDSGAIRVTPQDLEQVIGAGFKKGAYRSAKEYFLAPFRHQENELRIAVDPLLRRLANRIIRSVVRGLPGSRLKEAFPVLALVPLPLVAFADAEPFDISRPAHSVDVYIIAVWFMLREIEVAAARVGDLVIMRAEVVLDL
ncbi:unnamed protein product, partial [Symbiodinium sp. CCMP2456]